MTWFSLAGAAVLAAVPAFAAPQQPAPRTADADTRPVVLHGCVVPAENKTFVMTRVTEVPPAGQSAMPAAAHGRRIIFWLDNDDDLAPHAGHMVEVRGTLTGFEESEIELKPGQHAEGGLLVEFEGPGRDVVASGKTAREALGTTGTLTPGTSDLKTLLLKVTVNEVRPMAGSCR